MLAFMLLISAAIGIYFRLTGGRQKTGDEYLLADRSMTSVPVAFSLMARYCTMLDGSTYLFRAQVLIRLKGTWGT